MIENFEDITCELTSDEKSLVPVIVDRFRKRPGKNNMVSNPQMIEGIQNTFGIKISEPRIRKIIQYIRINNILPGLLGVSRGYYYSEDPDEIQSWINSMKQRENAIAHSRMVAESHLEMIRKKNGNNAHQFNLFDG